MILALTIAALQAGAPSAAPAIRIERPILRAAPEAGVDVAGYAVIANSGPEDRLVSLECGCAERVEVHRVTRANGTVSMDRAGDLPIPARGRIEVRPGSELHFMLVNLRAPLAAGDRRDLTLRFASGASLRAPFTAVADSAAGWQQAALSAELRPIAFLVGSCWRATFPGTSQTDTHCYTALDGGRQVRDRHRVDGAPSPYGGETIYRWDPAARQIRYDYYASDGGHSAGRVESGDDGLSFPDETYVGADGRRLTLRNAMSGIGPEGFNGASEMRQGDGWRELFRMRFTRTGPAPND